MHRTRLGLPENAVIYAYCGRLTHEKGLHSLLRVWKRLCDKERNIHLLLIGNGMGMSMSLDCESELTAFVLANKLDNCVTFTGVVEDVSRYIGCTDVFVLPYLTEALGIALIEAQLTGLSAIVRRVGGIHDVVDGATGRLVKPQDDADLLNAMEQFVADEEKRQKTGFWARNIAVERFAISSVTKKISINA